MRPSVAQSFAGSFNSFNVAGVPIDRDAFPSETSDDYAVSQRVGIAYSGQYDRRATAFKGKRRSQATALSSGPAG
jgi:hypothetical protein